ncbi:MAG TPA: hypothetical protein PLV36_15105, partial [Zoogloea sp.]|nr:hypothetical protein [Zoogloea sp.]
STERMRLPWPAASTITSMTLLDARPYAGRILTAGCYFLLRAVLSGRLFFALQRGFFHKL